MANRTPRVFSVAISFAVVACASISCRAQTTQRSPDELINEIRANDSKLHELIPSLADLSDPAKRDAAAPQAIPLARQTVADFQEFIKVTPQAASSMNSAISQYEAMLLALGDKDLAAKLAADAHSSDSAVAASALTPQILSQWFRVGTNVQLQEGVVAELETAVKAHPQSNDLADLTFMLIHAGPDVAITNRLESLITDKLTADHAQQFKPEVAQMKQAQAKLEANLNSPLVIAAKTVDGKDFTTNDWKGKVVLVDFWAVWCSTCVDSLPEMKQVYNDNHAKGLEIVGISNDFDGEALKKFIADQAIPWPQLFDPANAAQHDLNAISLLHGVQMFPTLFLIDKKGICRTVTATERLQEQVTKLLEE